MKSARTGDWRIDLHHHAVSPKFANNSMPISPPDIEAQRRSMAERARPFFRAWGAG